MKWRPLRITPSRSELLIPHAPCNADAQPATSRSRDTRDIRLKECFHTGQSAAFLRHGISFALSSRQTAGIARDLEPAPAIQDVERHARSATDRAGCVAGNLSG